MATQDEYIKTALRLPRNLHADIQASAKDRGRSMNAEIIHRLNLTFSYDEMAGQPSQEAPNARAKGWAEHLAAPENRDELEELLSVVQAILRRSGRPED